MLQCFLCRPRSGSFSPLRDGHDDGLTFRGRVLQERQSVSFVCCYSPMTNAAVRPHRLKCTRWPEVCGQRCPCASIVIPSDVSTVSPTVYHQCDVKQYFYFISYTNFIHDTLPVLFLNLVEELRLLKQHIHAYAPSLHCPNGGSGQLSTYFWPSGEC